jgi:hypothetical protein
MLCRTCVLGSEIASRLGVATVGADALHAAERAFTRSTAIKHLAIGFIGLAVGLGSLPLFGWILSQGVISRAMALPFVILAGSVTELVRGFAAWKSYKAIGQRPG